MLAHKASNLDSHLQRVASYQLDDRLIAADNTSAPLEMRQAGRNAYYIRVPHIKNIPVDKVLIISQYSVFVNS